PALQLARPLRASLAGHRARVEEAPRAARDPDDWRPALAPAGEVRRFLEVPATPRARRQPEANRDRGDRTHDPAADRARAAPDGGGALRGGRNAVGRARLVVRPFLRESDASRGPARPAPGRREMGR